ncbi:protein involved in-beta-glucan synthesis [Scheffersomyces coipomensis]|uniref:protein involved in-beta-glucan synthesis n=1 Tax=Scheffersomyces coipomensis TaxID=1788519 RepID=UPI00315D51CB
MGLLDNVKSFIHSISTEDHYASYDSPYRNTSDNNSNNIIGGGNNGSNGSSSRLHELNRLNGNNSSSNILGETPHAGYTPGMKSSAAELPLQDFNNGGQPPLPSMDSLWNRIDNWIEEEYPELDDYLNDGATNADLNEFENDLGCGNLPTEFRQFYKKHDGQFDGGKPTGLIMGLGLLDLESIMEDYALWGKVAERLEKQQYMAQQHLLQQQQQEAQQNILDNDDEATSSSAATAAAKAQAPLNNSFMSNQRSIPPNSVQPYYYHKAWVPLLKDNTGNQIALDLAPGPAGKWGQIILFGRDFDTKVVIASSFQEFIFYFVTDLENGNYHIDSTQIEEDLGYLSASRNDDYMVGDEDENEGQLSFYDREGKEFGKGVLRGTVSYIEVLKRRALKKYGLTEDFTTAFTPQRNPIKRDILNGSSTSPQRSQSPSVKTNGASTATNGKANSPLINVESASDSVTLPKETLIDDKAVKEESAKVETEVTPVETEEADIEAEHESTDENTPLKEVASEDIAGVTDGLKEVEL